MIFSCLREFSHNFKFITTAVLVLSFKTSKLLQELTRTSPETFLTSPRYYVSGIDHYFIISHLPSHEKVIHHKAISQTMTVQSPKQSSSNKIS